VNYRLHPDAALEHEEQVAYYEERSAGLGRRYHRAMLRAVENACRAPSRFKIVRSPNIRKVSLRGFPFAVVYREVDVTLQILAVAHHRREPNYWSRRT
jgi:plasmid stabilization system protein ParE